MLDQLDGARPLPFSREELGRHLRDVWLRCVQKWAEATGFPNCPTQEDDGWDVLPEDVKEIGREIGEEMARYVLRGDTARATLALAGIKSFDSLHDLIADLDKPDEPTISTPSH